MQAWLKLCWLLLSMAALIAATSASLGQVT